MGRRRCRWCGQYGHNRVTCTEYTAQIKQDAEVEVESNKERTEKVEWWHTQIQREYAKRIKADELLDGTPYEKPKSYREQTVRTCSYCGNAGHNRRKCAEFESKKKQFFRLSKDYRKAIKKQLQSSGWGIGALVGFREEVYMITEIDWTIPSMLTCFTNTNVITATNVNSNKSRYSITIGIPLPPLKVEDCPESIKKHYSNNIDRLKALYKIFHDDEYGRSYKLLSGVDSISFPKGWTTTEVDNNVMGRDSHFDNVASPDRYNNQWDARYNS